MSSYKILRKALKLSGTRVNGSTALEEIRKFFQKDKKLTRKSRAIGFYHPIAVYSFTELPFPLYTTVSNFVYENIDNLITNRQVLNWKDYQEAVIQPGFSPAKIILISAHERISKPSQITGIYYNTRRFSSFTIPFGRPETQVVDFNTYVSDIIMNNIDREKFRIRIIQERHPKC